MFKKITVIILCILCFLLAGCHEIIYEQSKEITGSEAEFELTLDSTLPAYYIQVQINYNYGFGARSDRLTGELVSPSGAKYTDTSTLTGGKSNQAGSTVSYLYFKNVTQEDGMFQLHLEKLPGDMTLKSVTVKVMKP